MKHSSQTATSRPDRTRRSVSIRLRISRVVMHDIRVSYQSVYCVLNHSVYIIVHQQRLVLVVVNNDAVKSNLARELREFEASEDGQRISKFLYSRTAFHPHWRRQLKLLRVIIVIERPSFNRLCLSFAPCLLLSVLFTSRVVVHWCCPASPFPLITTVIGNLALRSVLRAPLRATHSFSPPLMSFPSNSSARNRLSLVSRHLDNRPQLALNTPYSTERSTTHEDFEHAERRGRSNLEEQQKTQKKMSNQAPHPALLIPGPIEFDDGVLQAMSHYRCACHDRWTSVFND